MRRGRDRGNKKGSEEMALKLEFLDFKKEKWKDSSGGNINNEGLETWWFENCK